MKWRGLKMKCRILIHKDLEKDKSTAKFEYRDCILEKALSKRYKRKIVYSAGQLIDYRSGALITYTKGQLKEKVYDEEMKKFDFEEMEKKFFIWRTTNCKENVRLKKNAIFKRMIKIDV
jgi:hypothetical protein